LAWKVRLFPSPFHLRGGNLNKFVAKFHAT
jgi:hypothetical protein